MHCTHDCMVVASCMDGELGCAVVMIGGGEGMCAHSRA